MKTTFMIMTLVFWSGGARAQGPDKDYLVFVAAEAADIATRLGVGTVVVKAQIHAGGRGKGGGVKLARSVDEVRQRAGEMLGMNLVTHQTGPDGRTVKRVYVEEGCNIARELYLGAALDRASSRVPFLASTEGGVEIEQVAKESPEKIVRRHVPLDGLRAYQARALFQPLLRDGKLVAQAADLLLKLWNVYRDGDCTLAEVNPLVVTGDGRVLALDAKVIVDDSAEFRHREWESWRDPADETPGARKARERGLSYVKLDGDIGCVVNGAGLAMATMDLIKHYGGEPANFLDIGGSSNPEKVTAALDIITGDARNGDGQGVRAILFNIFGGITRCDDVARGIVGSLAASGPAAAALQVPLVIRLTGTNEVAARKILADAGLSATTSMDEGVRAVIAKAQEVPV